MGDTEEILIHIKFYIAFMTVQFLLICLTVISQLQEETILHVLVKHYCKYDTRKSFFTQRIINMWKSLPSYMLLTHVLLIVLRLTSINVGVVKIFIRTINVILPIWKL